MTARTGPGDVAVASEFIAGPRGDLEIVSIGSGQPSTVFAHGLGAAIPSTRPYASGVSGRRTFFHFASHGRSAASADGWNYDTLADELLCVADAVEARQALGISMGAGAIVRALTRDGGAGADRFDRVVLVMPASVDDARANETLTRYQTLAQASERGDRAHIQQVLASELPENARGTAAGEAWLEQQADAFTAAGMSGALRDLPQHAPTDDREELRQVTIPVLILAQRGDDVHPVAAAQTLAEHLPNAQLHIFDEGGLLFAHRSAVRTLVSGFLG